MILRDCCKECTRVWSSDFSLGGSFAPPGNIWQCLRIFFVVTLGNGYYWHPMGWWDSMDAVKHLNVHKAAFKTKIVQPQMSLVPSWKTDLEGFWKVRENIQGIRFEVKIAEVVQLLVMTKVRCTCVLSLLACFFSRRTIAIICPRVTCMPSIYIVYSHSNLEV